MKGEKGREGRCDISDEDREVKRGYTSLSSSSSSAKISSSSSCVSLPASAVSISF